jgi:TonB-dependent receptor
MHYSLPPYRQVRIIGRAILGWWLVAAFASAQVPAPGTIIGRVFNPASGEYVRDAAVRLEGTTQVVFTENDGSFQIDNVPAGPAAITVTYTGYETFTDRFTVAAGQRAVREINLRSSAAAPVKDGEVIQLEAFTVSSEREGNAKAIQAQRRNMNISTSVSADIFGDVLDGNVGEFIKYLPGVDLDYVESQARAPRLGGMEGQYVGVSFDGMRSASADQNRGLGAASRATSFEGFSITAVESIEINRTASPENDGDSPAGTINMKTKRAFDRKGRRIDYNYALSFNDEEFTLKKTDGPRDHPDRKVKPNWQFAYAESFFNQRFGVLLSANRAWTYTEQIVANMSHNRNPTAADPRPAVIRQIDFKDGPKFTVRDSLLLTADWKVTPRLVLSLNLIYSHFDDEYWNRNFTFVAANDNANVNNGRATVGGDGLTTVVATRAASGSVNNVATLNNGGGNANKRVQNRQYVPRFEYKLGAWTFDGAGALSKSVNTYRALERGFSTNEGGGVASSWIATRPHPQSWEWTIRQTSGADWYDLRSFTATNTSTGGATVGNNARLWITEKWTGTANARWVVPFFKRLPTVMKFGAKWDEETRHNNNWDAWQTWTYVGPGGNTTAISATTETPILTSFNTWANVGPQFVSANPFETGTTNALTVYNLNGVPGMPPRVSRNAAGQLFNAQPELFVRTATPENWYSSFVANPTNFRQTVKAGYGQADVRLTSQLQVRFGVRMERTENRLREFDPKTRAEVIDAGYPVNAVGTNNGRARTIPGLQYQFMSNPKVTRTSQYDSYFPSFVLKYQILPNLEFQAGFNRGIARPAINSLTGVWAINEQTQVVSVGNPVLRPELHKVYQSRLAYYFGGRSPGQFSVALSQDISTNTILQHDFTPEEFGVVDPAYAIYTFRTNINSDNGQKLRNLDLNYQQTLGFLPSPYLRGISLGGTYTRCYNNVRRVGVAPHRATGQFGYSYRRFNGSLRLVWTDDKPSESTYGRFFGAMTKLDGSLSFRLTSRASLFVQGTNLTNVKDEWYESPPGVQEGRQRYLRQMEEYGAKWMFGVRGTF